MSPPSDLGSKAGTVEHDAAPEACGRKALLLPLADDKLLREGAAHVTAFKLSLRQSEEYVSGVRESVGKPKETRLTPVRLNVHLRTFRARVSGADVERQIVAMLRSGDEDERKELLKEIDAVRAWAERLAKRAKRG